MTFADRINPVILKELRQAVRSRAILASIGTFLVFLFIKRDNGNPEARDGISDMVNITAADYGRIALVRIQPPLDFGKVSLVHASVPSFH